MMTNDVEKRLPGIPDRRLADIVEKSGGKRKVTLELGRKYFVADDNSKLLEKVLTGVANEN